MSTKYVPPELGKLESLEQRQDKKTKDRYRHIINDEGRVESVGYTNAQWEAVWQSLGVVDRQCEKEYRREITTICFDELAGAEFGFEMAGILTSRSARDRLQHFSERLVEVINGLSGEFSYLDFNLLAPLRLAHQRSLRRLSDLEQEQFSPRWRTNARDAAFESLVHWWHGRLGREVKNSADLRGFLRAATVPSVGATLSTLAIAKNFLAARSKAYRDRG